VDLNCERIDSRAVDIRGPARSERVCAVHARVFTAASRPLAAVPLTRKWLTRSLAFHLSL
jgi:hypothetical protein